MVQQRRKKPRAPKWFNLTPNLKFELDDITMKMRLVYSISGVTIQTNINWQKVRRMAEWFERVGDYAISLSDYNKKESQRRCDNRYRSKLRAEKAAIERLKRLQMGNYKYYKARNNKAWETKQKQLLEQQS